MKLLFRVFDTAWRTLAIILGISVVFVGLSTFIHFYGNYAILALFSVGIFFLISMCVWSERESHWDN